MTPHPSSSQQAWAIQQLVDQHHSSSLSCCHSPLAVTTSIVIQEGQYLKQHCSGKKNHMHVKGYIPRITASRHLMGKDSLVISFAVSINLGQKQKSFQSFQSKPLTRIEGFAHTPRARLISASTELNCILLFSDLPEPC